MRSRRSAGVLAAAIVVIVVAAGGIADAQSAENVALVINDASAESQMVGDHYVRARAIPSTHVIHLRTSTDETIEYAQYTATIEQPIAAALTRQGLQDRVLYIVLARGIPLRIEGTTGQDGTQSSVDSELTLLYRRMAGLPVPLRGRVDNPYYLGDAPLTSAKRFTHKDVDIYLVTRLDAFTAQEATALVDRGIKPATDGRIVLDQQDKLVDRAGEVWLEQAAERLTAQREGDRVLLDRTVNGVRDVKPVLGYYSWGSNDPRNRDRRLGMGFVPGALAATYVSTDARTMREPPADWVPSGDWTARRTFFADSPQSLIGDLIREGVTGVAGHVAEPYLQSTIRPQILFPAYLSGMNLVESFYLAMPHLSWQTVVVGDPLASPFGKAALARAEIEEPADAVTTLPGAFSRRRLAAMARQYPGVPEPALAQSLRSDALSGRGDAEGARTALEESTRLAPRFWPAHLQLAMLLERSGAYAAAADGYRKVLVEQPRNAVALNNLAYILAVRQNRAAEALPLARQAQAISPRSIAVLDTLGWVLHLTGDDTNALRPLSLAARAAPNNAEIRLHLAVVSGATGATAAAEFELGEALKLDPKLDSTNEVKQLREVLDKAKPAR